MTFIPRAVKQTNEYTISIIDGAGSGNVVVSHGENLAYSTITFNGAFNDDGAGTGGAGGTPANASYKFTVAGSTITASRGGPGGGGLTATIYITVTEYVPFFMLQAIQRGTITANGGVGVWVQSAALTALGAKAEVRYLGQTIVTGDAVLANATFDAAVRKKDATHVEAKDNGGFSPIVAFEVIDWR